LGITPKKHINLAFHISHWYDLSYASNEFSILELIELFTNACELSDNIHRWRSCKHLLLGASELLKNAKGDVQPLIDILPRLQERLAFSLYIELAIQKKIPSEQLPKKLITTMARYTIADKSDQIFNMMLDIWPAQQVAQEVNRVASKSKKIDVLNFLTLTHQEATPEELVLIAKHVKHDVNEIYPYFEQHSDAICEIALNERIPRAKAQTMHPRAKVLFSWLALCLHQQNKQLDSERVEFLVNHLSIHEAIMNKKLLMVLPKEQVEKFLLNHLDYQELLCVFCNEKVATKMVQYIANNQFFRSELDREGLAVIGTHYPHLLITTLQSKNIEPRIWLLEALSVSTDPAVIPTFIDYLDDTLEVVRQAAVKGLIHQGTAATEALLGALLSRKKQVRYHVCEVLLSLVSDPSVANRIIETTMLLAKKESVAEIKHLLASLAGLERRLEITATPINYAKQLLQNVSEDEHRQFENAITSIKNKPCSCDCGYQLSRTSKSWGSRVDSYIEDIFTTLIAQQGDRAFVIALSAMMNGLSIHYEIKLLKKLTKFNESSETNALLFLTYLLHEYIGQPERYTGSCGEIVFDFFTSYYQDNAIKAIEIYLPTIPLADLDHLLSLYLPLKSPNTLSVFKTYSSNASSHLIVLALKLSLQDTLPIVLDLLAHKKLAVRQKTAEALAQLPHADALPALNKARSKEKNHKLSLLMNNTAFMIALSQSGIEKNLISKAPLSTEDLTQLELILSEYAGGLPKGIELDNLPSLTWSTGRALSAKTMQWVISKLSEESSTQHSVLLEQVISYCDSTEFKPLWEALYAQVDDKTRRSGWVLFAAALLGDDALMHILGKDLDEESRNGGSKIAFYKVEILAGNGSTVALTWLDHWSRKARSKGLKARSIGALNRLAKEKGISRDEISDLAVTALGFDQQGNYHFPFGERDLRLTLSDEGTLLINVEGKMKKSAPATRKNDDAEHLKTRRTELTALRKHIKQVYNNAVERLEQAMVTERIFSFSLFNKTWGSNPILSYIARRVVWNIHHKEGLTLARLDESNQFVDIEDEIIILDSNCTFSVVHLLTLDEASCVEWKTLLADYEIVPPFVQLSRPIFTLPEKNHSDKELSAYEKETFLTSRMRSTLEKRGWQTGKPQDGGYVIWFQKYFTHADVTVSIHINEGFYVGYYDDEGYQDIIGIEFCTGDNLDYKGEQNNQLTLGDVSRIIYSEVISDVESIKE